MFTLNTQSSLSFRRQLAESIIEKLKILLAIKPLQYFFRPFCTTEQLDLMRKMPKGTIGHDLVHLLDTHQLKPIPKFENHDLKHLVLGYGMTSTEEIRMQAFLFGNGNRSFSCLLFLASGLLLPSEWRTFYQDYKRGKSSPSILHLSIQACMYKDSAEIKALFA